MKFPATFRMPSGEIHRLLNTPVGLLIGLLSKDPLGVPLNEIRGRGNHVCLSNLKCGFNGNENRPGNVGAEIYSQQYSIK